MIIAWNNNWAIQEYCFYWNSPRKLYFFHFLFFFPHMYSAHIGEVDARLSYSIHDWDLYQNYQIPQSALSFPYSKGACYRLLSNLSSDVGMILWIYWRQKFLAQKNGTNLPEYETNGITSKNLNYCSKTFLTSTMELIA